MFMQSLEGSVSVCAAAGVMLARKVIRIATAITKLESRIAVSIEPFAAGDTTGDARYPGLDAITVQGGDDYNAHAGGRAPSLTARQMLLPPVVKIIGACDHIFVRGASPRRSHTLGVLRQRPLTGTELVLVSMYFFAAWRGDRPFGATAALSRMHRIKTAKTSARNAILLTA
jgi:hypothetical protein